MSNKHGFKKCGGSCCYEVNYHCISKEDFDWISQGVEFKVGKVTYRTVMFMVKDVITRCTDDRSFVTVNLDPNKPTIAREEISKQLLKGLGNYGPVKIVGNEEKIRNFSALSKGATYISKYLWQLGKNIYWDKEGDRKGFVFYKYVGVDTVKNPESIPFPKPEEYSALKQMQADDCIADKAKALADKFDGMIEKYKKEAIERGVDWSDLESYASDPSFVSFNLLEMFFKLSAENCNFPAVGKSWDEILKEIAKKLDTPQQV